MDVRNTVREFLLKKIGNGTALEDETKFFELGLINSLFALQLILFLEETFAIAVENEDLKLETFSNIKNIEAFVRRKTGGKFGGDNES